MPHIPNDINHGPWNYGSLQLQYKWDAFQGIGCWELNASLDQHIVTNNQRYFSSHFLKKKINLNNEK